MKLGIYSIHDAHVGFMAPVTDMNDVTALRNFSVQVNTNETIKRHSLDFSIYRIGTFDSDSGIIEAQIPPEIVANASSLLEVNNEESR